ncbi:hypothetical protein A1359_18510 [Methylomonas lenta]|uniref:Uncharacterized protein n=1 Tax=Methylomonas lenta TaxID=980561 RepID=A0A177MVE2_9GAMM|nr:hypothetical protein [Methylomonas lenta]OAI09676.1 hypothetical protein A1359_18510 [Methylomonas lenta]
MDKKHLVCPECKATIRADRYEKHITNQHSPEANLKREAEKKLAEEEKQRITLEGKMMVVCEICGISISKRRLSRHKERLHRIYNDPKREEAARMRDALEETNVVSDQSIREYLARNPMKEEMGKFGVPQDKYRWGFYGSKTIEFDAWSRENKK